MRGLNRVFFTGIMLLTAPAALAQGKQQSRPVQQNDVKAGVDAYQRGDYKTALTLWRAAATRNDADAQFNLGQAYKLGRGVPANLAEAEKWYRLAALQGHEEAESNYGLALFENGKRAEALPWLERGAARGEPRTQYILGVMLFNGDAVAKDWVRAYALMTRAASTGLEPATRTLAQMDQYIPLADRQQAQTLARKMEADANSRPATVLADSRAGTAPPPPATSPAPAPATPARPASVASAPPAVEARPAPRPAVASGPWRVQLGAFAEAGNANRLWGQVRGRFPGRQPYYVKSGRLTRLLVGPYASRAEAASACGKVNPCVPVRD